MASPRITVTSFEDDFGSPTPTPTTGLQVTNETSLTRPLLASGSAQDSATSYGALASSSANPVLLNGPSISAAAEATEHQPQQLHPIPSNPRPVLTRTATAPARPNFLRRLTTTVAQTLELAPSPTVLTTDNHPKRPSYWTDHAHRATLLRTWDHVRDAAGSLKSKYENSVAGQLGAVEKAMLEQFPELGLGDVMLGKEWMMWVLGRALRQPFCTEGGMGRWEVLSAVGRGQGGGNWGMW